MRGDETIPYDPKAAHGLRRFEPDNRASITHGSYAVRDISNDPATQELADEIFASLPLRSAADRVMVGLLAIVLVRIQRATAAIEEVESWHPDEPLKSYFARADEIDALRRDLRGWIREARQLANDLGLSPAARTSIGVAITAAEVARERLEQHLAEKDAA